MRGQHYFLSPLRGRHDIVALLVFAALVMTGNGLVAPILSVYGASLSASATLVGMIITIFGIGRLITNIPSGMLSQRFGRRPILIAAPLILIIGSVGAALATDISTLLFWRFVQGAGSGVYMTVSSVMLADMARDEDRGRLMALHQASLLLGAGLGPVIGGLSADLMGYRAPFWAYGLVSLAGLLVILTGIGETLPPERRLPAKDKSPEKGGSFAILRDLEFLAVCLTNFGIFFTRTVALWMAIPLLAINRHGLSLGLVGFALAVVTIANFVILPWAGALIERFGAARISFSALILTASALILIALAGRQIWFWAGLALLGAASGFNGPAVATQAAEIAPRRFYGQAIGVFRTSGDLGFVIGPFIVGFLTDLAFLSNAGAMFLNAALLFATAALLTPFVFRSRKRAGQEADMDTSKEVSVRR